MESVCILLTVFVCHCRDRQRPERLLSRMKSIKEDMTGPRVVAVRQPKGPDGTNGFKEPRKPWTPPQAWGGPDGHCDACWEGFLSLCDILFIVFSMFLLFFSFKIFFLGHSKIMNNQNEFAMKRLKCTDLLFKL